MRYLRRFFASIMSASPTASPAAAATPTPTGLAKAVPNVPIPPRGVDYRKCIVLAPMVRSGELPSRLLALHYGADLVWGPETVDRSMIGTERKINSRTGNIEFTRWASNGGRDDQPIKESVIYRIDPKREHKRLIFQIGTAKPDLAVQAASLVAPDVAGIDVNAGCPKSFSTDGGMGAALLKTPDKLVSILEALVQKVGTPHEIGISVKIRILAKPDDTYALVHRLCQTGIIGLTVHCRTTPMRPREAAIRDQLSTVASICHSYGVACLMNGDVINRHEGTRLAEQYGADGAMIATSAEKNPSCFRPGESPNLPWREVVHQYMQFCLESDNRYGNTKYLLGQMVPGKDHETSRGMTSSKTYTDCVKALGFEDLIEKAQDVDAHLGLPMEDRRTKKQHNNNQKKQNKAAAKAKQSETAQAAGGGAARSTNGGSKSSERGVSAPKKASNGTVAVPETSAATAITTDALPSTNAESTTAIPPPQPPAPAASSVAV